MHLLPRLRRRFNIDEEVRVAKGVVAALVDNSPVSPGMRQLQTQLETVLTRGIRMRLETGTSVVISVDEALKWAASDGLPCRQIGFRAPMPPTETAAPFDQEVELAGHRVRTEHALPTG